MWIHCADVAPTILDLVGVLEHAAGELLMSSMVTGVATTSNIHPLCAHRSGSWPDGLGRAQSCAIDGQNSSGTR